jgi:hypothetical protein
VAVDEQLEWEARFAKRAAVAAYGSVVLALATLLLQSVLIGQLPSKENDGLVKIADHSGAILASIGTIALSYAAGALALAYLLACARGRLPSAPVWALYLLALAPFLLGIGAMLNQISLNDVADQFVHLPKHDQTLQKAKDLIKDRSAVGQAISEGGAFALGINYVLISINAMRAGLLPRVMGIIGVVIGVLIVLPIFPAIQPVLQLLWFGSLGLLFLGFWPGPAGRGPAWDTGQAIPWPTMQEAAQSAEAASIPPEPELEAGDAGDAAPKRRRKSKKRKRR